MFALICCVGAPIFLLFAMQQQPARQPIAIVTNIQPLQSLGRTAVSAAVLPAGGSAGARVVDAPAASCLGWGCSPAASQQAATAPTPARSASPAACGADGVCEEHMSDQAMAVLNRERARQGGAAFAEAFKVYRPPPGAVHPGGDLDLPETLPQAVRASAADGEVMLLCIGGSGSMRAGMNLVMNFRTMGLYHMLILAPERAVCDNLWTALPDLACVWWPSQFGAKPKPKSLYNTMFSKIALAFFETRKVLLERLVLNHKLNVLHLDADTVWFANPYPYFKTLYKDYSLIIQTDNPFVNAGILYVQNAHDGDAAAWVLQVRSPSPELATPRHLPVNAV